MRRIRRLTRGMAAFAMAALWLGAGCAQDVGDIDRTQPDKLKKSVFSENKEWYMRQTIVDTDVQASVIFEGFQSDLKRIRFIVTEEFLYACSTVPPAEGAYDQFEYSDKGCFGIVAAYPISGHFDVQRQYSTATGEQSNVIVENTSDRPWYEREYMRVDWSQNLVDGTQMFSGILGELSALAYEKRQEDSARDPYRTRVQDDYVEATTSFIFEPDLFACYNLFGAHSLRNCNGGELQMTTSFLQVPEKPTYKPLPYADVEILEADETGRQMKTAFVFDDASGSAVDIDCTSDDPQVVQRLERFLKEDQGRTLEDACRPVTFDYFQRFGYFRNEVIRYNQDRGHTDRDRAFYANRWNIWKTAYDEEGNEIPLAEREPKPIVFHLNAEYPRDWIKPALDVAADWDRVFKEAVRVAKGYDTLAEVEQELASLYGEDQTGMFVIRENGCTPTQVAKWHSSYGATSDRDRGDVDGIVDEYLARADAEGSLEDQLRQLPIEVRTRMCGELEWATESRRDTDARFVWQRPGDLRYSLFYWLEEEAAWLGYGPSSPDPVTGEIISATAHIAGRVTRSIGASVADQIQYINGDLSLDDVRYGDHLATQEYFERTRTRTQQALTEELTDEGQEKLLGRRVRNEAPDHGDNGKFDLSALPEELLQFKPSRAKEMASRAAKAALNVQKQDTRMAELMENSALKVQMLADPQMQTLIEAYAREMYAVESPDADMLHQSYIELHSPMLSAQRSSRAQKLFSEQNILTAEAAEMMFESLTTHSGVAEYMKGKSHAEIADWVARQVFHGTQLHEIGHAVGLRHNFSASTDALNYGDEFWLIEKAVYEGVIDREDVHNIQGEVADQIAGRDVEYLNQGEFRYASVMDYDYPGFTSYHGLGKYDESAIVFAYGEHIQQWDPDLTLPDSLFFETWLRDYSELPDTFAGDARDEKDEAERRIAGIENILNSRVYVPIEQAKDDLRQGILRNTELWASGQFSIENRPSEEREVAYNYCDDSRADFEIGCDVFDYGTTPREVLQNAFEQYRVFHPFRRYRRGNVSESWQNLVGYQSWVIGILNRIARPFRYYSIYQYWDLGDYTDGLREAALDAFNFYGEVMAHPQPGRYCLFDRNTYDTNRSEFWYFDLENVYVPASWTQQNGRCENPIDIGQGDGSFYSYDFSDEYDYRVDYVGSYIDKIVASIFFFQISGNFLFSPFFTDQRASNISYWTLFKDQTLSWMRGLVLGDYSAFAGVWNPKCEGQDGGCYEPPKLIDRGQFNYGVEPEQASMPKVFNNISFNHRRNAMIGAMLYNTSTFDRDIDFAQYVKLGVGFNEMQEYPEDTVVHEFIHPDTNQIYHAPQTSDGKSISVELVEWANTMKQRMLETREALATVEQEYREAREAYGSEFDPTQCETIQGDRAFIEVCNKMDAYQRLLNAEDFSSQQFEDVVARMDDIRFVWGAMGPNALR